MLPVTLCLILCLAGCQSLDINGPSEWLGGDDEDKLPEEIVAIWTDTVLHQPNQPAVRGFGGRVYFYADRNSEPIEVDGSLTVYAFDATKVDAESNRPLKKYVITADQLASHHSQTRMGHSYSVWVPWDQVGGPTRNLSLIVRWDGRNGGTVVSEATSKILPGLKQSGDTTADSKHAASATTDGSDDKTGAAAAATGLPVTIVDGAVRQASHTEEVRVSSSNDPSQHDAATTDGGAATVLDGQSGTESASSAKGHSLQTFSIDVPPSFQQRLRAQTRGAESSPADNQSKASQPSTSTQELDLAPAKSSRGNAVRSTSGEHRSESSNGEAAGSESASSDSPEGTGAELEAGSRPVRFPARRGPRTQPGRDPLRRLPHPATWPSALPPTPRSSGGHPATTSDGRTLRADEDRQ
ncbi:MAG: hypothetical protein U0795_06500 [Pirellulales bacterium]